MKSIYERPELNLLEIRVESGFAASAYDTWDDTKQGTQDVWVGYGEQDDEWA